MTDIGYNISEHDARRPNCAGNVDHAVRSPDLTIDDIVSINDVSVTRDRSQADLIEGTERTPLPAGIYECDLAWVLRATRTGSF
jgi:hypothetical protein